MTLPDRRSVLNLLGIALVLLLLVPSVIVAVPQVVGADHSYVVLSSSMSPTLHPNDVVIVNEVPPSRLSEGDIITFEPPGGHRLSDTERVTHRIIEVIERDDGLYFRTKGDAVEQPDQELVPADNVIGRVAFSIPLVGMIILFGGTNLGILLLLIVPSALLIISELWDLWQDARA